MTDYQDPGHEAARILVVDDDEVIRDLLCKILENRGYEVFQTDNGPDALDICRRSFPPLQLLITDIKMPVMSGYELADRCSLLYPAMGILYFSGSVPDESMFSGHNRAFVSKPFHNEELFRMVGTLLAGCVDERPPRRQAPATQPHHGAQGDYLRA